MSRARTLAAFVLLLLMVPSLVLAAMPLRYCIGSSGHHAIEFVLDGVSHSGDHESHGQVAHEPAGCAGTTDAFADGEKCTDRALMDTVSAPPTALDLKLLPLSISADLLPLHEVPSSISVSERVGAPDRYRSQTDPRIEVRRTVVLLI